MLPFSPFRLKPACKNYLWGGTKLITEWGKIPPNTNGFSSSAKVQMGGTQSVMPDVAFDEPLAETWELSAHKDGESIILDGELTGLTLTEAVKRYPELVSQKFRAGDRFPVMVKLIDAKQTLSVQVHPFTEYAMKVEHSPGKIESWYILDHEEGAYIYLGFSKNVSRSEFEAAIREERLPELLKKVYVNKGDMYFIPAGTIHAIGAGITLAEIQENSNVTYRVYDFGRVGADGKPRELHIKKALDVTNTFPLNILPPGHGGNVIISCNKFHVERVIAPYSGNIYMQGFRFLLCIGGKGFFRCGDFCFELVKGGNVFIPNDCAEDFSLDGDAECLITSQ